jgi:heme-degrading monooxygenase HmoA
MTARVFSVQLHSEKVGEFIQLWHEAMLPDARQQKGWKSARLLVDRKSGKAMVVGLWETEADALATSTGSAFAERVRAALASLMAAPPVVEHYEVAGEA